MHPTQSVFKEFKFNFNNINLFAFKTLGISLLTNRLFVLLYVFLFSFDTYAATITTAGSGNWSSTTNNAPWPGGTVPANGDSIVIAVGHNLTLDAARTCAGINILGTLTHNGNYILTVNAGVGGNGTIAATNVNRRISLTGNWTYSGTTGIGPGVIFSGTVNQTISGVISSGSVSSLTISKATSGTVSLLNNISVSTFINTAGIFDPSTFLLTAGAWTFTAGTLRVGAATWSGNYSGAITQPAAGIIEYYALGNQTVNNINYPGILRLTGSGIKTLQTSTTSITGNFSVTGSVSVTSVVNFAVGSLTVGAGATLDLATFTLGSPTTIILECGAITGSVITGTGLLTLGGGITVNDVTTGTDDATISCPVALGNNRTFTVGDDGTSAADLTIDGIISGATFGITKAGSGTLVLNGTNTNTGTTSIGVGTVSLTNVAGLGPAGNLLTMTGGTLDLASSSSVNAYNTTINGVATISSNRATSGAGITHTLGTLSIGTSDQLNLTTGSNVTSDTARLTFGATTLSALTPVFDIASGALLTLGALTGNVAFTKQGSGTLALNSTSTRTGLFTISAGTVRIGTPGGIGAAAATITMTGGTLDLAANSSVNAHPTTVNGIATIISNRSSAGAGVTHTLGTLSIGASDELDLTVGSNVTSDTARLTFGATTLSALTPVFDIASGALLTLGALTGNVAFTKQGSGTLALNSTSTRTGLFTISAGTVRLGTPGGIGAAAATITMTGGTLDLAANSSVNAHPTTINGNATIISNRASAGTGVAHTLGTLSIGTSDQLNLATGANVTSDTARLTFGATTLSGATPILDVASGALLTLGALTGDVAFTKEDIGTLVLNTASTRTGLFTINAGTVRLGTASGIGSAAATITMAGGTLNLTGNSSVNAHPITINGNATIISNRPAAGAGITHTLGTLTMGSQTLSIAGGAAVTSGTASVVFGTVTLSGNPIYNVTNPTGGGATILSMPQALSASTRSLTKQGNGALNFGSTAVSLNDLTVSAGTLLSTSNTLTLAGTLTNDGTFSHNNGTVVMGGTTQSIGGANAITFNTLTVNSGSTATLTRDIQCVSDLNVNTGGILDLVAQTANRSAAGGTLTVAGELRLGHNTGGKTGSNFPENYTTLTLTGSTIAYTRSAGSQTVFVTPYNNLTIGNTSNANTAGGDLTVNGVLTTTAGGTFDMSTHQLSGSLTSISNGGIIQTSATDNPPIPTGKDWGSGVVIYAVTGGGQTVAAGEYETLTQQNTSGTNTLEGNTIVHAALNFAGTGNGKLTLGSHTLTLNGSVSNMDMDRSLTANGSSNITIGGSGALGNSLFLDQTTPGTTNRLNNLTFNRSGETITLGDTIEIVNAVIPTNGTLATGGNLKLISNVSGTARVAAGTGDDYINGNVNVQRFVPSKTNRRWRFCGSPISTGIFSDLQDDIFITGAGIGFDLTISNKPSVFSYTESVAGNVDAGWVAPTNTGDALTVGKGYRIFIRGDRDPGRLDGSITDQNDVTVDLVGPLNQGDISLPVTYTSSGDPASDGWNLVANPYASPISWNSIHDAGRNLPDTSNGTNFTNIRQTIYIFNGATNSYTSYNAVSDIGTGNLGTTNGIIPAGTAFWVQAVGALPSLTIKENHKTDSLPAAVFKAISGQFTIKLVQDSITSDEAAFKYIQGTYGGLDGYDITKLYGADVNIASIGTDGSFLSANCKPFNGHSDTIPLSLGFANSGEYKMEFINPSGLGLDAEKSIYLVDRFKQQIIDIRETEAYIFTVDKNDTATFGNARFLLVVGEITTTICEFNVDEKKSKCYLYPSSTATKTVIYSNVSFSSQATITISDRSGKTITSINNIEWVNNKIEIDLSSYPSGLYFISIKDKSRSLQSLKCIKE